MRFSLSHRRALIGHDITVKVTAAAKETIARVATELDGRTLARDALAPPEVQYERMFHQVGGAGPGQDHVLAVHATSADGKTTVASLRWNDVS
jgi:predicted secreted protein